MKIVLVPLYNPEVHKYLSANNPEIADWDVFPCGDLFIRQRLKKIYKLDKVPTISETRKISEKYKPYRSVVAWYLWRWFN